MGTQVIDREEPVRFASSALSRNDQLIRLLASVIEAVALAKAAREHKHVVSDADMKAAADDVVARVIKMFEQKTPGGFPRALEIILAESKEGK